MSGSVIAELAEPLSEAVAALGADGAPVRLERPADPTHGDYASAVAMSLAKPLRSAPREIAGRILEQLDSPWVEGAEIAGPGFINLRLTPSWYGHVVSRILAEGGGYGAGATSKPQRIQVEFVSGNPTGPVTVGAARNAAYGDSLSRLFAFAGNDVSREYYFNDAGRQVDLFGASLRARARGEEVPEDGYHGEYVAEIAAGLGLPPDAPVEEWTRAGTAAMIAQIRVTLDRFRIEFDSWFLERSLYEDGSVDRAIGARRCPDHRTARPLFPARLPRPRHRAGRDRPRGRGVGAMVTRRRASSKEGVRMSTSAPRTARLRARLRDDSGMSTVEYAIGTLAAAAFAAVLYAVVTGDSIVAALTGLVQRALQVAF